MPPDRRAGALSAAAQRKSEAASGRARNALKALDARGAEITFQAVARAAGVSRQWLYTQPELRAEIEQLRAANDEPGARRAPARERASARARTRCDIATGPSWTRTSDYARKSRRSEKSSPSRSAIFEPATVAAATALHERLACTDR